jgi:hypothetical protein
MDFSIKIIIESINIRMAPLSDEAKSKLLAKLKEGRERTKKAREEAKAKGLPDPKPRKKRASKKGATDGAIPDPLANKPANETVAPIDGAPAEAVNKVAAKPVDPTESKSKPIDVPALPGDGKKIASKKDIVQDAETEPKPAPEKGLSSTGNPEKYNDNVVLRERETGNQVIPAMLPGQKESIKKLLKDNKETHPLSNAPEPAPKNVTVKKVKTHVPDIKAVEEKAPFSYATVRKLLYQ